MRSHTDVIEAFGGKAKLARAIGLQPKRLTHWNTRGIPSKYWPDIEEVARHLKLPITARDLRRLAADGA